MDLLEDDVTGFWPGWKIAHANFSTVPAVTSDEWKSAGFWRIFGIRFDQWVNPIFAVAFFFLFGVTKQKLAWYRDTFWKIMRPFGLKPHVDPVASDIMFGSGPIVVNSATNDTRETAMCVF